MSTAIVENRILVSATNLVFVFARRVLILILIRAVLCIVVETIPEDVLDVGKATFLQLMGTIAISKCIAFSPSTHPA